VYTEDEDARSSSVIIPSETGLLTPETTSWSPLYERRGAALLEVGVSEIHGYPPRPEGFEEPLFPTAATRRAVMEHFLETPWLMRASELKGKTGEAAHALEEPVEIKDCDGRSYVLRPRGRRRCSWRRRRVVEVLERWREVRGWWDEDGCTDRMVFRLLLAGGVVVDVARGRSGWLLVGVVD